MGNVVEMLGDWCVRVRVRVRCRVTVKVRVMARVRVRLEKCARLFQQ